MKYLFVVGFGVLWAMLGALIFMMVMFLLSLAFSASNIVGYGALLTMIATGVAVFYYNIKE